MSLRAGAGPRRSTDPLEERLCAQRRGQRAARATLDATPSRPSSRSRSPWPSCWRNWASSPTLLIGHSIGEIAAAHVAGASRLDDAAKLVGAGAARLMGSSPEGGAMVAIEATEAERSTEAIAGLGRASRSPRINGPTSVVVSGEREALDEIEAHFESRARRDQAPRGLPRLPLRPDRADARERLRRGRREPRLRTSRRSRSSPTSPASCSAPSRHRAPSYWVRNVREPVRFADAVATLDAPGRRRLPGARPRRRACAMAAECLEAATAPSAA